ncbi:MAG: four helix bundle protein [Deltaproteobacteria bacterium]|nr:MAG: four helix bundle protein [Deltaproteobacteria bacterium]
MLRTYQDLKVWQKAYALCLRVYKVTRIFPAEERYGLTSQMRRAAISIPCNIAEGYGRKTRKEYVQALYIAYGFNCVLETHVLWAVYLGYIASEGMKGLEEEIREVERMLKGLISSLESKE